MTIVDAKFNPVGTITVKDKDLALLYISEFLNDMRTYVPGTYFQLKTGSTKISIESDAKIGAGIWVGWYLYFDHQYIIYQIIIYSCLAPKSLLKRQKFIIIIESPNNNFRLKYWWEIKYAAKQIKK